MADSNNDMDKRPPAPRATARQPKEPKLYLNPMGWTTKRPAVNDTLPKVDRGAIMREGHRIAREYRARWGGTYAEALSVGLKAAWGQWEVAQSIRSLCAQVAPRDQAAPHAVSTAKHWGSMYAGI